MAEAFIAANCSETVTWCFGIARCVLIPLIIVGTYCGFRLSGRLFGNAAAYLFLTLWCFSPLLLGWGATICPDAVAAALGLAAVDTFYLWLWKARWTQGVLAGVCLGLLPLTKLTWIVAFILWPLMWCMWVFPCLPARSKRLAAPSLRQLMLVLALGLWTLNLGYLCDGTLRPLGKYMFSSQLFRGKEVPERLPAQARGNRFADTWLARFPVPLPAEFVHGLDVQRCDFERGTPSYLRGRWVDHGWWYYYLYALAVKVPLGSWCVVAMAFVVTILARGYNSTWREEMVVLTPGVAILILVSSQTGISVHSRYVLPALPFFFVWASKVGRVFQVPPITRTRRTLAGAVVLLMTWSVASSMWVYPHSLSYFNEVAGGPRNGGEHLLGSNVDWGQDLLYLKRWLDKHVNVNLDGLAFRGACPPALVFIPDTPYPPIVLRRSCSGVNVARDTFGPRPGWYALSVNILYDRVPQYRYFLDNFKPTAMAGYSIYVYHITLDDANRVRRQLGLPELPDDWKQKEAREAIRLPIDKSASESQTGKAAEN